MFTRTSVAGFLGRRGSGKSYLAAQFYKNYSNLIIFDFTHEHNNGIIVHNFDEFCNAIMGENLKNNGDLKKPIIIRRDLDSDQNDEETNHILRVIYFMGNCCVVFEEIQNISSTSKMPRYMEHIFTTGRHRDIAIFFTTQRPGELHKLAFSQCDHVFCGALIDENDLNYIKTIFKKKTSLLINMKPRNFLWFYINRPEIKLLDEDGKIFSFSNDTSKIELGYGEKK